MKLFFKDSFLFKLYDEWRIFFYVCIIFITGTLICAFIIGQSTTPFYIFQMYSQPIPNSGIGTVNRIYLNGKELNSFLFYQECGDIIRTNTDRFIYLKKNNFKDKYYFKLKETSFGKFIPVSVYQNILSLKKVTNKHYSDWLKNYLTRFYFEKIKTLKLTEISFEFKKGKPIKVNEKNIFKYDY